jgi:tRNA(Ile)-lysidine synthetase-like protein
MIYPVDVLLIERSRVFSRIWEYAREDKFTIDQKEFFLALSGGRDSLCAFYFLVYLSKILNYRWSCVHFDHGLRGAESDRDRNFCKDLCQQYSIPFHQEYISFQGAANFQDRARKQRMDVLKTYAANSNLEGWLVTGHHLDDAAESFLIGLHQGRWDRRMEPIPLVDYEHRLFRPLAKTRRFEITNQLSELSVSWREDLSNQSPKYLRNYYRANRVLSKCGEDLDKLSQGIQHFRNKERELFFSQVEEYASFQPQTLKECFGGEPVKTRVESFSSAEVCFPWRSFKEFSKDRFRFFWHWFFEVLDPTCLGDLDLKRLDQVFGPQCRHQRRFSLSKSKRFQIDLELSGDRLLLSLKKPA